jgi:hypothetical protein
MHAGRQSQDSAFVASGRNFAVALGRVDIVNSNSTLSLSTIAGRISLKIALSPRPATGPDFTTESRATPSSHAPGPQGLRGFHTGRGAYRG